MKPDPLQRSPSKRKPIRFFQNEFPSKYIRDRCGQCVENEQSCPNYIRPDSYAHVDIWFQKIFHGKIQQEDPRKVSDAFEKGYTCKLLYYLTWILTFFFVAGIATIVYDHIQLYLTNRLRLNITPPQVFYPLVCIGIVILITSQNKADEQNPTGCWQAWREINRIHTSWLERNENLLVDLICRARGATKSLQPI